MVKQYVVISVTDSSWQNYCSINHKPFVTVIFFPELYILFDNDGKLVGVTGQRLKLNIPPLQNENVATRFQHGMFACHSQNKACQFLADGMIDFCFFPNWSDNVPFLFEQRLIYCFMYNIRQNQCILIT